MKKRQVVKGTGELEPFSEYKLSHTLNQAGVDKDLEKQWLKQLAKEIKDQISTEEIHRQTFEFLRQTDPASAARYNLRQAVMHLGPTGYPFEQYVARLLRAQGYEAETNQFVHGACATYEADIVARNDGVRYLIECKYHNARGTRSDIKTALYIWARFEDVSEAWEKNKQVDEKFHEAWLVTNTKVTTEAEDYAKCRGLVVVSWYRPYRNSLKDMIVNTGLWPITCLSSLTDEDKKTLVQNNLVLCSDLIQANKRTLKRLRIENIIDAQTEAKFICEVENVEIEADNGR